MALAADGPWIDAKSIVKVMAAKAPKGTMLHFRAKGDGAGEAVGALVELVERDFDEGARPMPEPLRADRARRPRPGMPRDRCSDLDAGCAPLRRQGERRGEKRRQR